MSRGRSNDSGGSGGMRSAAERRSLAAPAPAPPPQTVGAAKGKGRVQPQCGGALAMCAHLCTVFLGICVVGEGEISRQKNPFNRSKIQRENPTAGNSHASSRSNQSPAPTRAPPHPPARPTDGIRPHQAATGCLLLAAAWAGAAFESRWAPLKSSSSTSESVGCACTLNLMSCWCGGGGGEGVVWGCRWGCW